MAGNLKDASQKSIQMDTSIGPSLTWDRISCQPPITGSVVCCKRMFFQGGSRHTRPGMGLRRVCSKRTEHITRQEVRKRGNRTIIRRITISKITINSTTPCSYWTYGLGIYLSFLLAVLDILRSTKRIRRWQITG